MNRSQDLQYISLTQRFYDLFKQLDRATQHRILIKIFAHISKRDAAALIIELEKLEYDYTQIAGILGLSRQGLIQSYGEFLKTDKSVR